MNRLFLLAALPALAISSAVAQTGSLPAASFVMAAAQSDQFEIREGKLAETKGGPAVKQFGAHMVSDHTKTSAELMAAVKKAGMQAPPPPPLRDDQQSMIAQLQGLSGAEFDKAYVAQQIKAHQEALALMSDYARSGDTPALKAAAEKTAPLVKMHLGMVEKMAM